MSKTSFLQRIRFSPFYVQMVATRKCNLSCKYCNENDHISQPVKKEVLRAQIDKLSELGTLSLCFTGGEPLLHPDIFEILSYAKSKIPLTGIITNGFLLTSEKIQKLNTTRIYDMQISIDGVKPNDITIKVLQFLKPKLELLHKYAKFNINVNTVCGSSSSIEVLKVIKFAKSLNFYTTVGLLHDQHGKFKLSKTQIQTYREALKLCKKPFWALDYFERDLIKNGVSDFKCRAGSRYLYIDEFGNCKYCSQQQKLYSKPLMALTSDDLKNNFYRKKPCSVNCTVGCVRRSSFLDSWRN